jgi:hypothetical protein
MSALLSAAFAVVVPPLLSQYSTFTLLPGYSAHRFATICRLITPPGRVCLTQCHETVKYSLETRGIQNKKWLCWRGQRSIYPTAMNFSHLAIYFCRRLISTTKNPKYSTHFILGPLFCRVDMFNWLAHTRNGRWRENRCAVIPATIKKFLLITTIFASPSFLYYMHCKLTFSLHLVHRFRAQLYGIFLLILRPEYSVWALTVCSF